MVYVDCIIGAFYNALCKYTTVGWSVGILQCPVHTLHFRLGILLGKFKTSLAYMPKQSFHTRCVKIYISRNIHHHTVTLMVSDTDGSPSTIHDVFEYHTCMDDEKMCHGTHWVYMGLYEMSVCSLESKQQASL